MKAKRALFWMVAIVLTPVAIVWSVMSIIWGTMSGLVAMLELWHFRLDCWSSDIQPGRLYNCPWTTQTYRGVFVEAFQGT
jgi:hypothetical protein